MCTAVAQRLQIPYFNGGLLYRALALWCVDQGLPIDNTDNLTVFAARDCPLQVSLASGITVISLADRNVSDQLRTTEIDEVVPVVARHSEVRRIINTKQKAIVQHAVSTYGGVVIDGRDATTVVAPDADVKILLVADEQARAQRVGAEEDLTRAAQRDAADAAVSDFLRPRPDVAVIDTSGVGLHQVVSRVLAHVLEQHSNSRNAEKGAAEPRSASPRP